MYVTVDEIYAEISHNTLLELTENGTDEEVEPMVLAAVASADNEVDGYLANTTKLPFVTVPKIVNKLSKTIAVYRLMMRKGALLADSIERTDYTDAVKLLKDIGSGTVTLGMNPKCTRLYSISGE